MNWEHTNFILAAVSVVIHKHFTIRKPRLGCADARALLSPPGDVRSKNQGKLLPLLAAEALGTFCQHKGAYPINSARDSMHEASG